MRHHPCPICHLAQARLDDVLDSTLHLLEWLREMQDRPNWGRWMTVAKSLRDGVSHSCLPSMMMMIVSMEVVDEKLAQVCHIVH